MPSITPITSIAIVFFSGYGHTAKQAEAVRQGAANAGAGSGGAGGGGAGASVTLLPIDTEGALPAEGWDTLSNSDAIVFGTPTYMGGPAWQFKKFADASSKPWAALAWKDKLAAGFTNSASINGDKHSTIAYLITLAMQHGMIWTGTALLPANKKESTRNDPNWLAGFSGALAQSPSNSSPDEGPLPGDLETARQFGARIAVQAARLKRGSTAAD